MTSTLESNTRRVTLAVAVVAVDLGTKITATRLDHAPDAGLITPLRNPDYSLGIIHAESLWLIAGTIAVLAVAAWAYRRAANPTASWWVGPLVLGGAGANLIDRAVFGSVHDFITTPWVVFNLADVAVAIGLIGFYHDLHTRQRQEGRCTP